MKRFLLTLALLCCSFATPFVLGALVDIPIPTEETKEEIALEDSTNETVELSSETPAFSDIEDHWGEAYIEELYERGAISGYADGSFLPDASVTRAELLKVSMEAFNITLSSYNFNPYPFTDVTSSDWFKSYIDEAYANGVISGSYPSTYRPNESSTREEAIKIIIETSGESDLNAVTPNFNDIDPYSDWVAAYSAYAKSRALMSGDSSGNFNPSDEITRAELCKIVVLLIQHIETKSQV